MASRNQEIVVQGDTIVLDAKFYDYAGGNLTDPDSPPTFEIFDPHGVSMFTDTAVKTAVGCYEASYTTAPDAELSNEWKIQWVAIINGAPVPDAWEYFHVIEAGSIWFGHDIIISDFYCST